MLYPNQAAVDYEIYGEADMSPIRTANDEAFCGGTRIDIGFGTDLPLYAYLLSVYDAADATGRWVGRIFCQELSIDHPESGTPWQSYLLQRIKLYQAVLTVTGDHWELDGDDLEWSIDVGGGESLVFTFAGPTHLEGDGYDPRENVIRVTPIQRLGDENVEVDILPDIPDLADSFEYSIDNAWKFGWEHDATTPTNDVDESFGPPDVDCDCERVLTDIVLSDPPTVWDVSGNSGFKHEHTKVDLGVWNIYCDPDNHSIGTPGTFQLWRMDAEYYQDTIYVDLNPQDAELVISRRSAAARCSDPIADPEWAEKPFTPYGPVVEEDPHTYMAWGKTVVRMVAHEHYGVVLTNANCPLVDPENPYVPEPDPEAPSGHDICFYEASALFEHVWFTCEGAQGVTADVGMDRRHVVICIDVDDNVLVTILDHALNTFYSGDLGFTATWAHVKIDRMTSPLIVRLWTIEGGAVKVRTSTNGGRTFGAATTIAASGAFVTADIDFNGNQFVYWINGTAIKGRRYDRNMDALEAEFTAVASGVDSAWIAATVHPMNGGVNRVVLWYVTSGARTYKTSQDGITFS